MIQIYFNILSVVFGLLLSMPLIKAQSSPLEELRSQITDDCIQSITNLYEFIELREEMKSDALDYCDCLYSILVEEDLERLHRNEITVRELVQLNYKERQTSCADNHLSMGESKRESNDSDSLSPSFWVGELLAHYIQQNELNNEEQSIALKNCFEPIFSSQYISFIDSWAEQGLTARDIVVEVPQIKKDLEDCLSTNSAEATVLFRIQIAAGEKGRKFNNLDDLGTITTEAVPNKSIIRYQIGDYESKEDARSILHQIKSRGYPEAFIIKR